MVLIILMTKLYVSIIDLLHNIYVRHRCSYRSVLEDTILAAVYSPAATSSRNNNKVVHDA